MALQAHKIVGARAPPEHNPLRLSTWQTSARKVGLAKVTENNDLRKRAGYSLDIIAKLKVSKTSRLRILIKLGEAAITSLPTTVEWPVGRQSVG